MDTIIVTDLTRFKKDDEVCIAGIDLNTGNCIRPMPYLSPKYCRELNILPGAMLNGEFKFHPAIQLIGPHQEDMWHEHMRYVGPSSTEDFKRALDMSLCNSIEEGFKIRLIGKQRLVPLNHELNRSIITIKVFPQSVFVIENPKEVGKLRLNFTDMSGRPYVEFPITDLGFHTYAHKKYKDNSLDQLNAFIHSQSEAYLRIGLARSFNDAYWMQVNGVYTFPAFLEELRCYK